MLEDMGRFFVVYYDDGKEVIETKDQLEAALGSAAMGVVPDFWIDEKELIVKCPPNKTGNTLNKAAHKRSGPVDATWVDFKLLKIRWDSVRGNYDDANTMMSLCEDHSSGVDEAFIKLQDKSLRKLRAINSKYVKDFSTDGKILSPIENKQQKITKSDKNNNNLPPAPSKNILCKKNSTLSKDQTSCLEKENIATDSNRKKPNVKKVEIVKKPYNKIKEKSIEVNHDNSSHNDLNRSSSVNNQGTLDLLKLLQEGDSETPLNVDSVHHSFNKEAPPAAVYQSQERLPTLSNCNITDVPGLVSIILALDDKVNKLLAGQEQIIVQLCKAKVTGESGEKKMSHSTSDTEWMEEKRVLIQYLQGLDNGNLFVEFDQELAKSQKLRAKVLKYLSEKIHYGNWKSTAKCALDAVMHKNVQKLYSLKGQGQSEKKALKLTNVYQLLLGIVKASMKKSGGECASEKAIGTHFSSILKQAPFTGKDYQPKSRQKKTSENLKQIAHLLDVPLTDDFPAFDNDVTGGKNSDGKGKNKRKSMSDGESDKTAWSRNDDFDSPDSDTREEITEVNQQKKKRKVPAINYSDDEDSDKLAPGCSKWTDESNGRRQSTFSDEEDSD